MKLHNKPAYLALAVSLALNSAYAQEQQALPSQTQDTAAANEPAQTNDNTSGLGFERIVVTGAVSRNQTVMQSSVSVSSLTPADIEISTPRSTAEIFRMLPGVRSESTGGEGNANIAVRGLPVASGGAKFLALQEDGLPVLQFGDIAFGNADIFLRADATMAFASASDAASAKPVGPQELWPMHAAPSSCRVSATSPTRRRVRRSWPSWCPCWRWPTGTWARG